jgi:hypothetical protein
MKRERIPPQPDKNFLPVSRVPAHHRRIDLLQPYELGYWSIKFGVSEQELAEAVQKVGNAEDVAIELGKPW